MKKTIASQGTAIVLAWPETVVPQTNAWYDTPMRWLGINKNGTYKVGHSAIVVAHPEWDTFSYYDFGRYGTQNGLGRVRHSTLEKNLSFETKPLWRNSELYNTSALLKELSQNKHTNGTGRMIASVCSRVDIYKATAEAQRWLEKGHLPYGPFVRSGTKCSRFTSSVLKVSERSIRAKLSLHFPLTISPSPWWNVIATCGLKNYYEVVDNKVFKVSRAWWPIPHKKTHKIHDFMWV